MSRLVHKYTLPPPGSMATLTAPKSFSPVHVDLQHGTAMVWAEVDDSALNDLQVVEFFAIGTGWMIPDEAQHIGTIVDDLHGFVWHYYMRQA